MTNTDLPIKPGQKIRVHEDIDRREGSWTATVEGVVTRVDAEKTGSWYAHGKDTRLWLYRIRLRKQDGEETTLTVDRFTRVEVLEDASTPSAES